MLLLATVVPAAPASADACYTRAGCVQTARSASSFRDSVGVNTHMRYTQTAYGRYEDIIRPRLRELGVSHIREDTFPAHGPDGPMIASRFRDLGLGLNLLVGFEQGPTTAVQTRLDWIKANGLASQVVGIEGSNESWDDATAIRNLQCDIYARVKNDPQLASKPVIGPSGGPPFYMSQWYVRIGDVSGCVDRGNLHPYPGEDPPHMHQGRDLSVAMDWGRLTYGRKPYWVTENGYWTKSPNGSHISEWAAGVYIPRMYLENFRRGIERTQAYELIDVNTESSEVLSNYGLLRTDGSRKPAFVGLANTMQVLADTAPASGSLGFGIVCTSNCHSPIRHVLLRHSSGAYYLAVWSESRVWTGDGDTSRGPQAIDLVLHETPAEVAVIDPASSATPFKTVTGAATVSTNATDHVRLIKITSAAPAAEPEPTPEQAPTLLTTEAEDMAETAWFPDVYPDPGVIQDDSTASAFKRMKMQHYGELSKTVTTQRDYTRVVIAAKGDQCAGAPAMTLKIDGVTVGSRSVTAPLSGDWSYHLFDYAVPARTHNVVVSYDNDYEDGSCNRNLYLDRVTIERRRDADS